MRAMTRAARLRIVLLAMLMLVLGGCASGGDKRTDLDARQYDYSAAVRWNDFEGAWNLVDPEVRAERPMTALEFERYKQIQVSGYTEMGSQLSPDKQHARREIQINVINKHTMTERSLRYTELWRFEPSTKTWWLASGLPDFWGGQ